MARPKVGDLIPIGAIGSAKKGDVLEGKTYSSDEGVDLEGAMPNIGKQIGRITTKGGRKYISKGYHDGTGYIDYDDPNHIASNIRDGVIIAGVRGTLKPHVPWDFQHHPFYNSSPRSSYVKDIALPAGWRLSKSGIAVAATSHSTNYYDYKFGSYDFTYGTGTYEHSPTGLTSDTSIFTITTSTNGDIQTVTLTVTSKDGSNIPVYYGALFLVITFTNN